MKGNNYTMWITENGEKLVWCEDCQSYIDIKNAKEHNIPEEYWKQITMLTYQQLQEQLSWYSRLINKPVELWTKMEIMGFLWHIEENREKILLDNSINVL